MRELREYTDELHRRVELKIETRRQHRRRALTACVPLVLALVIGTALAWPRLSGRNTKDAAPMDGMEGLTAAPGTGPVAAPDGVLAGGAVQDPAATLESVPEPELDGRKGMDSPEDKLEPEAGLTEGYEIPADFSFRLVWGCYGISSYDSATGELVKTTDATRPEDYVTTHRLTEAERNEAWALLSALELESYPASYDPYNDPASAQRVASEPSRDLILSLRAGGSETTVSCRGICLGGSGLQGYDEKARAFLAACDRLSELLQSTPEWQALPDYEFYYE